MRRSQVAMEYLIIVGLVLVILIPITLLYVRYSTETSYAVTAAKVDSIANEIVKSANSVYFYGEDTQTSVQVDFPDGIETVRFDGREIIFEIRTGTGGISQIVKVADVQFADFGTIPVIQGRKKIIIKSLGDQVAVSIPCDLDAQPICGPEGFPRCINNECVLECQNYVWSLDKVCSDRFYYPNGGDINIEGYPFQICGDSLSLNQYCIELGYDEMVNHDFTDTPGITSCYMYNQVTGNWMELDEEDQITQDSWVDCNEVTSCYQCWQGGELTGDSFDNYDDCMASCSWGSDPECLLCGSVCIDGACV